MGLQITALAELDRRITLRSVTVTIDTFGGEVKTNSDKIVWAALWSRGGDGGSEYGEKGSVVTANHDAVWVMHKRTVTLKDQVIYDGVTYDIERIEPERRNKYLRLYCNADKTA